MSERVIENKKIEEYAEYWMDKGAIKARNLKKYQEISEEEEKRFKMILGMTIPWQRKIMEEIIDEIKCMENARSSIEMDSTMQLIYNSKDSKVEAIQMYED